MVTVTTADLLDRTAEQHSSIGGAQTVLGMEREFDLAGPEFRLHRTQRQTKCNGLGPQQFDYRLELVQPRLGQVLETLGEKGGLGRRTGLSGIGRRQPGIVQLQNMKFDLKSTAVGVAPGIQLGKNIPADPPRGKRHGRAIGKIEITQHPAGTLQPRQHPESCGVRYHDDVPGTGHLWQTEPTALRPDRVDGAVRGVFGKQRGGDGAAVSKSGIGAACRQALTPQNAMLISKRQPNGVEILLCALCHLRCS